jgi:SAM-dependent methyltransferase
MMIARDLLELLTCPNCHNSLNESGVELFCGKCSIRIPVIDNIPRFHGTTEKNIIRFDEAAIRSPANWTGWRRKNHDFFLKKLEGIKESSVVLDIGAGTSPFAALFKSFTSLRVDFEPYEGIDFLTDLNKPLPVSNKTFDVVIMSNLLEHICEPLTIMTECHRILKPKGNMIMTVPFLIKVHQEPHDFLRYTEHMLKRLLTQSGFQEFEITKIGNIFDVHAQVSSSVYKFVSRKISGHVLKQKGVGLLYRLHRLFFSAMLRVSGCDEKNKEDYIGYPHGYGVLAVKED